MAVLPATSFLSSACVRVGRCRSAFVVRAEGAGARNQTRRDLPLPGNQGLLLDRTANDHDVVCAPVGQSWVMQRPRRGGPGLVLSSKLTGMQLVDEPSALPPRAPCVALAAVEGSASGARDVSVFQDACWFDVTDYRLLDDDADGMGDALADACSSAATECLGLVLREDALRAQRQEAAPKSKNPRRTRKVRFTCNLCGEVSTKAVSPHAWASGSVFARCDGCHVIHKLIDNLKLFHELSGTVYPPRKISTLRIPPGLPQRPSLDHHTHPGIWDSEDAA